ncbi:MAG: 23S rRNA (guanosine(2251)-2'-O)-methyltransferase RlmB [Actinobacteria bacterium]|nr:23S rRNA (guanosine(2251)-2'-O)-methyltransferase RlmB [Actinomycetota bacterium]
MARAGIGDRVEGFHAVLAAFNAGRVRVLHIERGRLKRDDYADLADRADRVCRVLVTDDVRSLAETTAPQGIVAECAPLVPATLMKAVDRTDPAALIILDRLEDPRNVGAIARSALAAGVRGMVVPTRRAAPLTSATFKAAVGALEHMDIVAVNSVADTMRQLRDRGVWLVGLDGSAEDSLFGCNLFTEPVGIVIGAEGKGLSRLVAERCDSLVSIPLSAGVESLNASVAASLAVFELARVRGSVT